MLTADPSLSHPQGFVAAVSPFNFTAIGGNLAGAPALMVSVLVGFKESQRWRGQAGERLRGGSALSEAAVCLVWDVQGANLASLVLWCCSTGHRWGPAVSHSWILDLCTDGRAVQTCSSGVLLLKQSDFSLLGRGLNAEKGRVPQDSGEMRNAAGFGSPANGASGCCRGL